MNLSDLSIRRPVFATILIAALMVFGLVSYPRISTQLFPDVEFPVVTVTVVYPGADSETLERKVADKIEEEINTLGGVRTLRSMSVEGAAQVIVEFELDVQADQAVQDVRDRVARVAGELPDGAEPPVVEKFDMGAEPVMTIALAGDLEPRVLTDLADDVVKAKLQGIEGVGSIELIGGREREVQVFVDPEKLAGFGLTVQDVGQAIAAQNLDVPAGKFDTSDEELAVKTRGQTNSVEQLGSIFIPAARGQVRIRDVASVVDGIQEPSSASFLDGESAVSLLVRKQSGANLVQVADAVHEELTRLRPRLERAGATFTVPNDSSIYVKRSMHDVQIDLVIGAVLAVLVIYFFLLDRRATLISAIAIPTSVISTFAFVAVMGFTFNNMTLLALSLAIGILVDDAIVVMENIHRHLEKGKPAMQAASDATREIFLAVLAMTSTILAVFVPVALMKGIVGRFFFEFGLTVGFSVATSMLVSFTLTPMMSSRMLKAGGERRGRLGGAVDTLLGWCEAAYGRVIRWALAHRAATVLAAVAALGASVLLISRVPTEFLPAEDRSEFKVTVEMPHGSTLDKTSRVAEAVARDLREHGTGVEHTVTTVASGTQGQSNEASVLVKLSPPQRRAFSQQEMMSWVRQRYAGESTALITVEDADGIGGGSTQPIQLSLRGNDMDELVRTAEALKTELARIPGFVDLDTSYRGGRPEVSVSVDRDRASALGVPVATVAANLRALLAGDPVGEMTQNGNAYDIRVRLAENERARVETLSNLKVRAQDGTLVDLSNVVTTERGLGPSRIDREGRQRQVTVLAGLDGLALGDATKIVDEVAARVVPGHLTVEHAGSAQLMEESFGHMITALLLAILLVYMILAVQFDSFVQPLTIMISLPLSVIGAFGALALTGMTLSIFSMIGIIMLMGLVTKNAILLVDFANQLRAEGRSTHEALVEAGMLRLRPILMTALSMIFGMLPVALAISEGGEVRAPMAVCVIGGMITSTVLTLAVVPVVYSLMEGLAGRDRVGRAPGGWWARLMGRLSPQGS